MHYFTKTIARLYDDRFIEFGPHPEASLWFSRKRQIKRFEIISDQIVKSNLNNFSINDIGCGYGEFYTFLKSQFPASVLYYFGVDISSATINYCRSNFNDARAAFSVSDRPNIAADFSTMSGTFNYSPSKSFVEWNEYIFEVLNNCWKQTQIAMVFNLQIGTQATITEQGIVYFTEEGIVDACEKYFGNTDVIYHKTLPRDATFYVSK